MTNEKGGKKSRDVVESFAVARIFRVCGRKKKNRGGGKEGMRCDAGTTDTPNQHYENRNGPRR